MLLGGAVAAWPRGAGAQQGERMRRIGVLSPIFARAQDGNQLGGIAVSRIFLSHSSANNDQAVALYDWLQREGWKDEVFLDLDPIRGILREILMNEKHLMHWR